MTAKKMLLFPDGPAKFAYQVIISRLDGEKISNPEYRRRQLKLIEKGIGGFILFGGKRNQIKPFIAEMQSRARIPLLIASDIERGAAQQVDGTTAFPSQMAIAAAVDPSLEEDTDLLVRLIGAIAAEAKDIGINMPLIPVLDVNTDPDNPIICTRAFSDKPGLTAWFGTRYIEVLERNSLISCPKHFPGHGATSTDSHISLPVIRKTRDDLMDTDIKPFQKAIDAGTSSVMIGHLSVPALDARPASLSRKIITGFLREELGFRGLVLTDALNMHALKEFRDVGTECLRAGADILLHPEDPDATADELFSAFKEKRLEPGIIEAAVTRIIEAKSRLDIEIPAEPDFKEHALLSKTISRKAVTLLKNAPGVLPLRDPSGMRVIFGGEAMLFDNSPLKSALPYSHVSDTLLVALFTSVAAWKGSSGISDEECRKLSGLISGAKKSVVVSFGSPYVLRYFGDADVLIAAYDPTVQAQEAVIKCLLGAAPFTGRLPVQMPEVQS